MHSRDLAFLERAALPALEWSSLPILVDKRISGLGGLCLLHDNSHGLENDSLGLGNQLDLLKALVATGLI